MKPSELFCFKDTKNFAMLLFFLVAYNKKFQRANATDTAQDGNDPPDDWLKLEFLILISGQSTNRNHYLVFLGGDVTGLHQWLIDSENFHGSLRLEEIVEIQATSWGNQLAQDENIRVCVSAV